MLSEAKPNTASLSLGIGCASAQPTDSSPSPYRAENITCARGQASPRRLLEGERLVQHPHRKLQTLVAELNRLYRAQKALHQVDFHWSGFEWIDFRDVDQSTVSFIRRGKNREESVIVVANFTPVLREGYRVGVPAPAAA